LWCVAGVGVYRNQEELRQTPANLTSLLLLLLQIEAVENHMPEILIVDEIGTEAEALACRTIAERGVVLIGTAHGCFLET
jgi:stage III sporulation protein SpoIIIAA